jgi:hypothetical protein
VLLQMRPEDIDAILLGLLRRNIENGIFTTGHIGQVQNGLG